MISIIIRTRNEERWIKRCLEGIRNQQIDHPIEIILVDNCSTDKTVQLARETWPEIKVVQIEDFLPGLAINQGIRASRGEYFVCLSAHCPPVDDQWLAHLLGNLEVDASVAGVYGRQVPTSFSSPVDKRDLLLTFGLDRRVQLKDTFFHNANSMIPKKIWERFPFDEATSNIEDRLWGKAVIEAGYKIVYEPEAIVFHSHGIHQDNRPDRVSNVVRIMESQVPDFHPDKFGSPFDVDSLEIAAMIPLRSIESEIDSNRQLIGNTIRAAKDSKYIKRVFVTADSQELVDAALHFGAEAPYLRTPELSHHSFRVDEVLCVLLSQLEEDGYLPDVIVPMEILYPFRPSGLLDGVIETLIHGGFDSVTASFTEHRPCWREDGLDFNKILDYDVPRGQRNPIHIGLPSLACATYPSNLRSGRRLAGRIGIFETSNPLACLEVRTSDQRRMLSEFLGQKEMKNEIPDGGPHDKG